MKSVLNYDKNKTYDEYFEGVNIKNGPTIYAKEKRNSVKL